ncbi:MBL fold metallo-hydrolase [Aestuariibacter sp. AA17]|uniref:MBL fold metallo-hydrolase n=1 Tax=Fluctibacter corallii TaxID=2984329 RepID=A0ABT3A6E9_9ALTE|nr:MBL fold metallo-hydrolase [Aestuariibacter sp. AA17]MCV2884262.1 MBL fold metallo-hydrolase [Aestuariibacter sp. AA17]
MYSVTFLGVGSANSLLGCSSCVINKSGMPWLMIDCGHDSLSRYKSHYHGSLPEYIFITHLHFDHISGLEQLFFQSYFQRKRPKLFVPVALINRLHDILGHVGVAESGVNVWDVLDIMPVKDNFWFDAINLSVVPTRHHKFESSFALHMPGVLFYTGDTKPIPEILHYLVGTEIIFHDCCIKSNPSHTSLDELLSQYDPSILNRIVVYHYSSEQDRDAFTAANIKYAKNLVPISIGQHSVQTLHSTINFA